MAGQDSGTGRFAGRVLIALGLAAMLLLLWRLRDVLLLAFASILFAIVLVAAARLISRRGRLGPRTSLAIASVLILGLVGGAVWVFGNEIGRQLGDLAARLPDAWASLQARIGAAGLEREFHEQLGRAVPSGSAVLGAIGAVIGTLGGALSGVALALMAGLYLAAQPDLYRSGLLRLVPDAYVARVADALDATAASLRAWLLGQLASMTITGVAIAAGLIAIGVPSPLALGLIAGLMGFVPMIGPLLGALPGVLVALTIGGDTLLFTILLYFVVQQLAGAVIEPLIMQRTVKLPPAVTLFALFAVGALFGPVGVLLGGPIAVTAYVLVRTLYVRDTLGRPIG